MVPNLSFLFKCRKEKNEKMNVTLWFVVYLYSKLVLFALSKKQSFSSSSRLDCHQEIYARCAHKGVWKNHVWKIRAPLSTTRRTAAAADAKSYNTLFYISLLFAKWMPQGGAALKAEESFLSGSLLCASRKSSKAFFSARDAQKSAPPPCNSTSVGIGTTEICARVYLGVVTLLRRRRRRDYKEGE